MEKGIFWKLGEALKPEMGEHEASAAAQEMYNDNVRLFEENKELEAENEKYRKLLILSSEIFGIKTWQNDDFYPADVPAKQAHKMELKILEELQ